MRHLRVCAFSKYQSVKEAVYEIAQRAREDQGCADDEMRVIVLPNNLLDVKTAEEYGHQPEER